MPTSIEGDAAVRTLTDRMRVATRADHVRSDRLVNLKLALVLTSPPLYGEAISLFAPIYDRIESLMERHSSHPQLGRVALLVRRARRGPALRSDVAYYLPRERREEVEALRKGGDPPELESYLSRLEELGRDDPVRLLAYAYHMYMAIFAGGRVIRAMVVKAMGLPKGQSDGVQAFTFEGDDLDRRAMMMEFKRVMNEEVSLTKEEGERVVGEGVEVFRRNNALVSTVRGTGAYRDAARECCDRWVARPMIVAAVLVAAYASWTYSSRRMQPEDA